MSTDPSLEVVSVERIDGTGLIIEFSDATTVTYTAQELADLKPDREKNVTRERRGVDSEPDGLTLE